MKGTNIEWGKEWGVIKNGLGKRGSGQTTETRIFLISCPENYGSIYWYLKWV